MPELSYGSHFFQDLVETGIFYVALFDNKSDVVFNESKLKNKENIVSGCKHIYLHPFTF